MAKRVVRDGRERKTWIFVKHLLCTNFIDCFYFYGMFNAHKDSYKRDFDIDLQLGSMI